MKKTLFILSFLALVIVSNAQRSLSTATGTLDTVSNTGNDTWFTTVTRPTVSLQFNITKISGTVGGTLQIVYSNDGVNFYSNARDTALTPANASGTYGWQLTNVSAPYIGVKYTGTGTMSASATGSITSRY